MKMTKQIPQQIVNYYNWWIGVLICLPFWTASAQCTTVDQSDSLELVRFYQTLGGPNWTDNTGWLTAPVRDWYGITLTEDGCGVKVISFTSNNLTGGLPGLKELDLPSLTHLTSYHNHFGDSIPDFTHLPSLTHLTLVRNEISGRIPDFAHLPNLLTLDLHGDSLRGTIPDFAHLPNLTKFVVNKNELTGSIPDFTNLPNLQTLHVSRNYLTGSIPDFTNLPNLVGLLLNTNYLTGAIPDFMHLIALKDVRLNNNRLVGEVPDFSHAESLAKLTLENNQLTFAGALESNVDYYQQSATFTTFTYSPQALIPLYENNGVLYVEAGGTLANNTYQWFDENNALVHTATGDSTFTPTVSGTYYGTVDNSIAIDLALRSQPLTITNTCRENLESDSLELIRLYQTLGGPNWTDNSGWLTTPVSEWFGITLTDDGCAVESIYLDTNNLIGELTDLDLDFPYLTKLALFRNGEIIGEIPNFSKLPNLTTLSLLKNSLTGTVPDFAHLPNLTYLSLHTNQLEGTIPDFTNLPNLTSLGLQHNDMVGTIPNFASLPNLSTLYLHGNRLTGEIPDFIDCLNIAYLSLGINQLSGTIPDVTHLTNLVRVDFRNNQLSGSIPDFTQATGLISLELENNSLTFSGALESNAAYHQQSTTFTTFIYSPQAFIPLYENNGVLYVEAGGTLANNTYQWFDENDALVHTATGDSTFTPTVSGTYYSTVDNSIATELSLRSESRTISIDNSCQDSFLSDSLELVRFYQTLGGSNWTDNSGWLTMPISNWYGIQLHQNGCGVEHIRLSNNNVVGNVSAISDLNLPYLLELDLSQNQVSGTIPDFSDLPNLGFLNLSQNQLTGTLPNFSNIANIATVNVSYNQLTGNVPNLTTAYPLSFTLDVSHNQLSGTIPNFSNLSNTFNLYFYLNDNQFSGTVPDFSIHQNYLRALAVFNNEFTFAGLEENTTFYQQDATFQVWNYSPQALIPTDQQGSTLSVQSGGTLANNTYQWFTANGNLVYTATGDNTFVPSIGGNYYCLITNSIAVDLTLRSQTVFIAIQPPISGTGIIAGCDFVCAGNDSYTYGYSVSGYHDVDTYQWTLEPANIATIIDGQGTNQLSISYTNPQPNTTLLTLRVTPQNSVSTGTSAVFEVILDTECVWPGDVDYNGKVEWAIDAAKFYHAVSTVSNYQNNNPNYELPVRDLPCTDTNIPEKYTWSPHPAVAWAMDIQTDHQPVNGKHADPNGNGALDISTTFGYNGMATLPNQPSDPDVIMHYAYHDVPEHNGNQWASRIKSNNARLRLQPKDRVLANGNELRLTIVLEGLTTAITEVHSIAFEARFKLGSYRNPHVIYDNSRLGKLEELNHAEYLEIIDVNNIYGKWHIAMGRKALGGIDFQVEGDNGLCTVECIAAIPDFKQTTTTLDSIEIEIVNASVVHVDGSVEPIGTDSTTIYITNTSTPPVRFTGKAFLEGCAYDAGTSLSQNNLRQTNLLPTQQPYHDGPWEYEGGESFKNETAIPENAVDWVLLEARDADNPKVIVEQKAVLLLTNGQLLDPLEYDTETPKVNFFNLVVGKAYHFVLRHRNHLAVVSATPVLVNTEKVVHYDFSATTDVVLGNNQLSEIAPNVFALKAGDCNGDGIINVQDFNDYQSEIQSNFEANYYNSDFTMDGQVLINDFNVYKTNASAIGVGWVRY